MSANSINIPFPIFNDVDGDPLDAGYVYIGTANLDPETNPISLFFDKELTIPAPQPIRTINGFPSNSGTPSRLYVSETNYSITVKNKNGSLVYNSDIDTDAVSSNSISFNQNLPSSILTTVESKLKETVSVKDFGAIGDGATDDTAAIIAADNSGAKNIYFPQGSYKVTSKINKKIGVSWFSNGFMQGAQSPQQPSVKIIVDGPTSGDFITIDGDVSGVGEANLKISGIAFVAEGSSVDLLIGIQSLIKLFRVDNCSFTNFITGVKSNNVENWVTNNYFSSCGICIDVSGGESHILGNHGFPSTTAILVRTSGNIIQGNKFFGDGAGGENGIIVWGRQNSIVNNVFDAFTDAGIILRGHDQDNESNTITGNSISGIGNGGTYNAGIVLDAVSFDVKNNAIVGNSISNKRGDRTTLYGFYLVASTGKFIQNNTITGNVISDYTTNSITVSGAGTKTNNIFSSNAGDNTISKTHGIVAGYNGLTVNHGLGTTPDHVSVTTESSVIFGLAVDSINSTSFRLLMRDSTGALVTSGSPANVNWSAEVIKYT